MDDAKQAASTYVKLGNAFAHFARRVAATSGRPITFVVACVLLLGWALSGPLFHFSNTWQLVVNTGTTIITFLMVFLIQNTQNRDSQALQLKVDEIIRALKGAHTAVIDLENLTDAELEAVKGHYQRLAKTTREMLKTGQEDTGTPPVATE
jgi:low affinity Fe/Cu permease